jgi:hypothetical protein
MKSKLSRRPKKLGKRRSIQKVPQSLVGALVKHYSGQTGGQVQVFHSTRRQRGDGLGNILKSAGRFLIPILAPILGSAAKSFMDNAASGVIENRSYRDVAKGAFGAALADVKQTAPAEIMNAARRKAQAYQAAHADEEAELDRQHQDAERDRIEKLKARLTEQYGRSMPMAGQYGIGRKRKRAMKGGGRKRAKLHSGGRKKSKRTKKQIGGHKKKRGGHKKTTKALVGGRRVYKGKRKSKSRAGKIRKSKNHKLRFLKTNF